jgi:hypothetical protein
LILDTLIELTDAVAKVDTGGGRPLIVDTLRELIEAVLNDDIVETV